jgi:hypothetical protein
MIIRIFAVSVLTKPLNNAQIVRGVFCLYTFKQGEYLRILCDAALVGSLLHPYLAL